MVGLNGKVFSKKPKSFCKRIEPILRITTNPSKNLLNPLNQFTFFRMHCYT